MAKNDLQIAAELISRPDISPEDRDALIKEYPELQSPPPEMEAPSFLSDQQPQPEQSQSPPTPAGLPPGFTEGITEQGPPAIAGPVGSMVGIQPSEIPAQAPANMDMSLGSLEEQQRAEALDRADQRAVGKNATGRLSMEPRASVNAEGFDGTNGYYHFEPTLAEVEKWAARTGNESAYNDLKENGEDSETYKKYADVQWKKVRAAFEGTGETAVRVKYIDPQTAAQWVDATIGNLSGRVDSFLGGYDDAAHLGVGKQAVAYAKGAMKPKAEEALEKSGVIRPWAERMEDMKARYPVESIAGSIYGYTKNPLSLMKGITRAVGSTIAKLGVPLLAPIAEGAAASSTLETVNKLGAEMRGEEAPTWGDVGRSGVVGGYFGGITGYAGEALGRGASAKMASLRKNPVIAETLDRVSLGTPGKRGGTTMKPMSGGVQPHEEYRRTAKTLAKEKATAAKRNLPSTGKGTPTTEMAKKIEWQMREELDNYRNKVTQDISNAKDAYFRSTETDPRARVSLEAAGKKIMQILQDASPGGLELPGTPGSQKETLLRMLDNMREPRFDAKKVSEIMSDEAGNPRRLGSMWPQMVNGQGKPNKSARQAAMNSIQMAGRPWRTVTPKQFDDVTGNISHMLHDARNKASDGILPRNLDQIQAILNETRDKFPANAYAPDTAIIRTNAGPKEVKGFSAMQAKHHKMLNNVRNAEEAMGLKGEKRIEDTIDKQKIAVMKRIKQWGLSDKSVSDDTLRKLFKDRPDLVETLDAIGSGEAYEAYLKGTNNPAGVTTGQGAPRVWGSMSLSRLTGPYLDPAMNLISKLEGKGGDIASIAGMREDEIEFATAAERALLGIKDITVGAASGASQLYKLFQQYKSRGLMDEMKRNKEKTQ